MGLSFRMPIPGDWSLTGFDLSCVLKNHPVEARKEEPRNFLRLNILNEFIAQFK
jgi:hypothetical protein